MILIASRQAHRLLGQVLSDTIVFLICKSVDRWHTRATTEYRPVPQPTILSMGHRWTKCVFPRMMCIENVKH